MKNRKGMNETDRFSKAVSQIVGKRINFTALTGNVVFQASLS